MRWPVFLAFTLSACAASSPLLQSERANAQRRAGNFLDAYELYISALCHSDASLEAARGLVEVWQQLGSAGNPADRLMACDAGGLQRKLVRGLALASRGHLEQAQTVLATCEALAKTPEHRAEVAYRRGLVALKAEDPARAHQHFETAASFAPGRADIRLATARAHFVTGAYAEVIEILKALLELSPSMEELDTARRLFERSVRAAEPALPAAVNERLESLLSALERGEVPETALPQLLLLARNLSHPRVLTVAGLLALSHGAELEARRLLRKAAEANPLDPDPLRALGTSLRAAGRDVEAVTPLRRAFERNPLSPELTQALAESALGAENYHVALLAYRALTVLEPEVSQHRLWVARLERRQGNIGAARRAALQGHRLTPKSVPLLVEWASIEAELARRATTPQEREAARHRTQDAIDALLAVAPEHPAALALAEGLDL